MTIREMLDDGVKIQGRFEIRKIDGDDTEIIADGESFEDNIDKSEAFLDMEVEYIYPIVNRLMPWKGDMIPFACTVIEVKEEEE